jgi:hypothetical protein
LLARTSKSGVNGKARSCSFISALWL